MYDTALPVFPPSATTFRKWMDHLTSPRGNVPEWPWLLRELLNAEFVRQRALDISYASEVFKDRDDDDPTLATILEKRQVRDLYHHCLAHADGCLTIGDTVYWLLGYEWPNQGRDKGRRADLVGLTREGCLIVFECKLADNSYGPFAAVLEGLDYLACLTSASNSLKILSGFTQWSTKPTKNRPSGFETTTPDFSRQPQVIVLATKGYFDLYERSGRGGGFPEFVGLGCGNDSDPVSIRFAETDFLASNGRWMKS
jgi:hypothetical protein